MKILSILLPAFLFAKDIYIGESLRKLNFNESKTKCIIICDKKEYKESQIAKAIEFYKKEGGSTHN